MSIRDFLRRFRLRSVQISSEDGRRSVDNVDALAAAAQSQRMDPLGGHGAIPPDYVKQEDEGRPRH